MESSIESPAIPVFVAAQVTLAPTPWLLRESSFEIGVDRDLDRRADDLQPFERHVEWHLVVGAPHRPRDSRAGRCKRLKTKLGKESRAFRRPTDLE